MNITQHPLQRHLPASSRLVYGCMGLGGGWNHEPTSEADLARAHAAVEAALEIGITVFDHADIYTLGKAESSFGTLMKRQPSLRDRVILQSKCGIRFRMTLARSVTTCRPTTSSAPSKPRCSAWAPNAWTCCCCTGPMR